MWVVVADGSKGRIFETPSPVGNLTELESHTHADSRLQNKDFETDSPGRVKQNRGRGDLKSKTSYEPNEKPKEREKKRFAKKIADKIDKARSQGAFERLVLISPPKFLGYLRGALSKAATDSVIEEITKDLTKAKPADIKQNLSRFSK